ncbi:UNVERIFIED_CONTAM: hypothetical protein PYX00_007310 [Menopon gallinae]|uniref:Protein hairless n=1 Tax=Menopon gallinae TaxID=328185 RepID=A0AAW2HIM9_9NEOP
MRVPEDSASTSCAIMSEEKSLNGLESDGCNSRSPSNEFSDQGYASSGGRLKFFKDGKFILELSHRRDGEKMSWIPVPKKTYWSQPVASTVTSSVKQESTTSLSVSDDNSSAQLSPWQRDHCWKQTSPRKATSHEMTFLMIPLPRAFHIRKTNSLTIKRKRRRPFELIEKVINSKTLTNLNGFQRPVKVKRCAIKNGELNSLVDRLWECLRSSESAQMTQKHSPSMVSPRKRILREFEKVSLVTNSTEEQSQLHLKRRRPKTSTNGQPLAQSNSKGVSNYSITSLLGTKSEPTSPPCATPPFRPYSFPTSTRRCCILTSCRISQTFRSILTSRCPRHIGTIQMLSGGCDIIIHCLVLFILACIRIWCHSILHSLIIGLRSLRLTT